MLKVLADSGKGDAGVLRKVERALAELRRGSAIILAEGGGIAALVAPAEAAIDQILTQLRDLSGLDPALLITAERARALGLRQISQQTSHQASKAADPAGVLALSLTEATAQAIAPFVDPTLPASDFVPAESDFTLPPQLASRAIDLVKLARLLPAAIFAPLPTSAVQNLQGWADRHDLMLLSAQDVESYGLSASQQLLAVAEAQIPLQGAEDAKVIAFRPSDGGVEHLAILIGRPKPEDPLLVRLHSECFTGDLLGSLRCDCGDQLRGAIEIIGKEGAGALLYLNQEGRGIGLVNKLRAYQLQDQGSDTLEANETLGFGADERIYMPAAEMLRQLGFRRIRLLTNNPEKVKGLSDWGLTIEERVPHSFPSNGHNAFYLATKASRFGHLF